MKALNKFNSKSITEVVVFNVANTKGTQVVFIFVMNIFSLWTYFLFEHIAINNNMVIIQRLKFALTVGKCRGFCRGISMFFSICLGQKNAEAINFLGILKNNFSKNKKYIFSSTKKKEMSCLIKKYIFIFYTIFKLSWCRSFTVLSTDVCFPFSYIFLFSYTSFSKTWGIERILALLYQYKWQKFNKMNKKRSLGYHNMNIEYVTSYINSLILQLLLRWVYRLIFALSQKS